MDFNNLHEEIDKLKLILHTKKEHLNLNWINKKKFKLNGFGGVVTPAKYFKKALYFNELVDI